MNRLDRVSLYGWLLTAFFIFQPSLCLAEKPVPSDAKPLAPEEVQNVESLMNALNETLEENRQIRKSMTDLQQMLEQAAVENRKLKSDLRRLDARPAKEGDEWSQRIADLQVQVKTVKETITHLEKENEELIKQKTDIGKKFEEAFEENRKLKKMLSTTILASEKEELVKVAQQNSQAAQQALRRVREANVENQTFKKELDNAYYQMGNMLFERQDYLGASEYYKKAIAVNPTNAWVHHNLGVIYDFYLHDRAMALIYYQNYLNYKPADDSALKIRQRMLDLNLLKKVEPTSPLRSNFEQFHKDA